jgi:hypothetical protein
MESVAFGVVFLFSLWVGGWEIFSSLLLLLFSMKQKTGGIDLRVHLAS